MLGVSLLMEGCKCALNRDQKCRQQCSIYIHGGGGGGDLYFIANVCHACTPLTPLISLPLSTLYRCATCSPFFINFISHLAVYLSSLSLFPSSLSTVTLYTALKQVRKSSRESGMNLRDYGEPCYRGQVDPPSKCSPPPPSLAL